MKTISAAILALGLLAGGAEARVIDGYFTDLDRTAPRSVFDGIGDSAPRSAFEDLRDTAPRSTFGDLRDSAPRAASETGSSPFDHAGE
jgi:hypothetical protein